MAKSSNTIIFRNFNSKAINASSNPIFKNVAYVLNPDKVAASFYHNLSENEWEKETNIVLDKFSQKGGRIAFHSVISASGGITHTDLLNGTKDFITEFFAKKGTYQIIAAVHSNTKHPHVHIVGSTIDVLTGKRLQLSNTDLVMQRDLVDRIFSKYGLPLRKKVSEKAILPDVIEEHDCNEISPYVAILLDFQEKQNYEQCNNSNYSQQVAYYGTPVPIMQQADYGNPVPVMQQAGYGNPVTFMPNPFASHPQNTNKSITANVATNAAISTPTPRDNPFRENSLLPPLKPPVYDPCCTICNKKIRANVLDFSIKHFNAPLCIECQESVRNGSATIPHDYIEKQPTTPFFGVNDLPKLGEKISERIIDEIITETNFYVPAEKVLRKYKLI